MMYQKELFTKKKLMILTVMLLFSFKGITQTKSKSDIEQITETLQFYMEGSGNGERAKLEKAFHSEFNLYGLTETDSLRKVSKRAYINHTKEGEKLKRISNIIAIDYENNMGMAKVEIVIPNWKVFIDYFLLIKQKGQWKILQKTYTFREPVK